MSAEIADILDKAAEVIEQHGWTQEVFVSSRGAVCLVGAINAAATGDPLPYRMRMPTGERQAFLAAEAMRDQLGTAQLSRWNDKSSRTPAQVITALRKAAAAERAS